MRAFIWAAKVAGCVRTSEGEALRPRDRRKAAAGRRKFRNEYAMIVAKKRSNWLMWRETS